MWPKGCVCSHPSAARPHKPRHCTMGTGRWAPTLGGPCDKPRPPQSLGNQVSRFRGRFGAHFGVTASLPFSLLRNVGYWLILQCTNTTCCNLRNYEPKASLCLTWRRAPRACTARATATSTARCNKPTTVPTSTRPRRCTSTRPSPTTRWYYDWNDWKDLFDTRFLKNIRRNDLDIIKDATTWRIGNSHCCVVDLDEICSAFCDTYIDKPCLYNVCPPVLDLHICIRTHLHVCIHLQADLHLCLDAHRQAPGGTREPAALQELGPASAPPRPPPTPRARRPPPPRPTAASAPR